MLYINTYFTYCTSCTSGHNALFLFWINRQACIPLFMWTFNWSGTWGTFLLTRMFRVPWSSLYLGSTSGSTERPRPTGSVWVSIMDSIVTVRKRSCGKVMFLHLSVILSTGGVCPSACWDTHPSWADTPPRQTPPGQTPPWADTPLGRHPPRADTPSADTPLSRRVLLRTVSHPTGMHSCFNSVFNGILKRLRTYFVISYRKKIKF